MTDEDFEWAAALMERRREAYERFSPVFWKPAEGVRAQHAGFMRSQVHAGSAVAVRSDNGFLVAAIREDRYDVDDFAVVTEDQWATEGRLLLESVVAFGPAPRASGLRVVTARRDLPKRQMLQALGLTVVSRWWVKPLAPSHSGEVGAGAVALTGVTAFFGPAPPVYAPGGPVCILGDIDSDIAVQAATEAAQKGAVLAVVTRNMSPDEPPENEPVLSAAGFDNASEFFEGHVGSRPSSVGEKDS